uniref:hypothetical protein n=1 Tax=Lapillicoccus sp. TaxID=1909287 RepID=UPI0039832440
MGGSTWVIDDHHTEEQHIGQDVSELVPALRRAIHGQVEFVVARPGDHECSPQRGIHILLSNDQVPPPMQRRSKSVATLMPHGDGVTAAPGRLVGCREVARAVSVFGAEKQA